MRISDWSSDVCSSDLQPMFDTPGYNGINPYALGFGMMTDIERICTDPTEEDREWFPDIAGSKEPMEVLKHIWANYRDESFIAQFQIRRASCRVRVCQLV